MAFCRIIIPNRANFARNGQSALTCYAYFQRFPHTCWSRTLGSVVLEKQPSACKKHSDHVQKNINSPAKFHNEDSLFSKSLPKSELYRLRRFSEFYLDRRKNDDTYYTLNDAHACTAHICTNINLNNVITKHLNSSVIARGIWTFSPHQISSKQSPLYNVIRTFKSSTTNDEPAKVTTPKEVLRAEEKSRVEEAVEAIKEKKQKVKEKALEFGCSPEDLEPKVPEVVAKKTLWERVKHEAVHYYNGFKLLYFEVKIAMRHLWRVMNGKSLTRRERRQFLRTVADLFRLVPFLVFLVIPFMEFFIPVVVKVFPNMLPSTFEDKSAKEEAKRKKLKVKIEMAKFLQDTVEEMAVTAKQSKTQKAVLEFANFFEKIRTRGEQPSNEDIIRFSKLFEDEITLDNMSRGQLKAINRLLSLQTIGTDNYLSFQLRMRLRQLKMDDLMIKKEGVDALSVQELQSACQARGMRAVGVPEARLRSQLKQWLELHLQEQVPISLLLMSRALYLPENISSVDKLKETLSQLPETLVDETEIKVAEVFGEEIDRKRRLEILKKEEELIAAEKEAAKQNELEEMEKRKRAEAEAAEILVDRAKVIQEDEGISKADWITLKGGISNERDVLTKIKVDREEFREELKELEIEDEENALSESLGSSRLGKKVDNMITKIEARLKQLEEELIERPEAFRIDTDGDGKITTEELIAAIRKLQHAPSEEKCRKIADMLDQDKDGNLELDDVETVLELLCIEDVDLTPEQVAEIVALITRENDAKDEATGKNNKNTMENDPKISQDSQ